MTKSREHQPLYRDLTEKIKKGFLLLDEKSQQEVKTFITNQQHQNGAFTDRAGNPDFYYSLFGAWMSKALELEAQQEKLSGYMKKKPPGEHRTAEHFSHLLISVILKNQVQKPSVLSQLNRILKGNPQINPAYKVFLFLLSFDAFYGRKKLWYYLFRTGLTFYSPPENAPCSFMSALLIARFLVGINVEREQKYLFFYFEEGKGFKAFRETENADLLSTAVALFALKKAGGDLRVVAPDALNLVQQNYNCGAFLSGDGDETRDLEYTFYGLLILGTLAE
ncbi:MAG: hypothetical protein ACOC1D_00405 [Prolixibacteraceae bacterium]